MPNINKVVYGNTTLIDLSTTTLSETSQLANGITAYDRAGNVITGTASGGGGTGAVVIEDTTDTAGGTIRTITAIDISDSTLLTADQLLQGVTAYNSLGVKLTGTATSGGSVTQDANGYIVLPPTGSGGGGTSATQHVIHLEFTDETDTDINVYYDDALIGSMITAYEPTTYGGKTVDIAQLDNVTWYTRPTETWEVVFNDTTNLIPDTPYPYWWIASLSDVPITVGSVWRVSIDGGTEYRLTATDQGAYGGLIGNPLYTTEQDDGSGVPFSLNNAGWGAWSGGADTSFSAGPHLLKIERLVSS